MSLLFSLGAFASSASGAKPGMVLLKPTSIAHSGTSASVGANGQVTFTAVTSLSLNGVFSATYDNYVIVWRGTVSANKNLLLRLRASGTNATGTNYVLQSLQASSTTVNAARGAAQDNAKWAEGFAQQRIGANLHVYGPALAQPTAVRVVSAMDELSASIIDGAITHSLSTSYDGITFYVAADNFTGALQVYGVRG